tara:strand:+ start:423 stop:878 length:456 start_codon:yes stop_codon:yes gene_type:complete
MKKDFVIRGQLASGETEIIEFGGYKEGYAYKMTEFSIFPSTNIGGTNYELAASVTAAKTLEDPSNPNFNNEGLIATALNVGSEIGSGRPQQGPLSIVNDTFLITQNLILAVIDTNVGLPMGVNYQMRFESVKLTDSQQAVSNYKQFSIFDE